jgi:hypothetical protein
MLKQLPQQLQQSAVEVLQVLLLVLLPQWYSMIARGWGAGEREHSRKGIVLSPIAFLFLMSSVCVCAWCTAAAFRSGAQLVWRF